MRYTLLLSTCAVSLPLWLAACAPEAPADSAGRAEPDAAPKAAASALAIEIPVLNTYHPDWLQIDMDEAAPPGDANLYAGADPADGTASFDLPAGGTTYMDWDDLSYEADEHRYLDLEGTKGKDATAFPRSDSCVGPAHVLSKMDLTYVAVVNNTSWASFAVQRADNNGDAGYYWLITRDPPGLATSTGCRSSELELTFDLSGPDAVKGTEGDLMLAGHFMGSDVPLLTVYRAVGDTTGTLAVDALDFEDPALWSAEATSPLAAVNTTVTRAGGFGATGVDASDGTDVEDSIFAEAAVEVNLLQGAEVCGGIFYATVITRSSGAGGTSPDLKDVAGPFAIDFEPVRATASLEPLCDGLVAYEAVVDDDTEVTCDWVFDDGTVVTDSCEGTVAVTPGARYATVTVNAVEAPCGDEVVTDTVEVGGEVLVTAEMAGSCDVSFAYAGEVSGAIGATTWAWTFKDELGNVVATSSLEEGKVTAPAAGHYDGALVVTDDRGAGLLCTGEALVDADVMAALTVDADLVGTCEETLRYEADVTGGDGAYTYAWTFTDGLTSSLATGERNLGAQPRGGTSYGADLRVTWTAEDGQTCAGEDSDSATVYSPITVSLAPDGAGGECPATDAVTYTATIAGGGPDVTLDWTVDACDGAASCGIDPADADTCETVDLQLTVRDPGECPDATSERETYTKYTVVSASDN